MENKREMQLFGDWLKMWELKGQCSESTMRKLIHGKMKEVFLEFFGKNMRPDEWIQNTRDNLYVRDHLESSDQLKDERMKQTQTHSALMDKGQRELDELTRKEESLRAGVLNKRQLFPSSSHKYVKLSKLDEELMKGLKLEYLERVERMTRPFLEKLEMVEVVGPETQIVDTQENGLNGGESEEQEGESESERLDHLGEEIGSLTVRIANQRMNELNQSYTHPHPHPLHVHQRLEVKNGHLVEERMKEMKNSGMSQQTVQKWLRESRVRDIQRIHLQSRHMERKDLHGIHGLEQILENRVGGWSLVHLELMKENRLSQSYIASHPIQKFLDSNNELTKLLIGNEVLKGELKFYETMNVERDPLLRELEGRLGKSLLSVLSPNIHPQLTLPIPQHQHPLMDEQRIEDILIALMKSWPSVKHQVRRSQALREELYSNKLPRVKESLDQVLKSILNHADTKNKNFF